jgi:hypothetical protein
MKQCKKILDKGQRCSNPVVPGTDYCKLHKRQFTFRKITPQADTETTTITSSPPEPDNNVAFPSQPGEKILFPKLIPDKRDILVAPSACIYLQSKEKDALHQHLCKSIVLLSAIMPLSPYVQVKAHRSDMEILMFIRPEPRYQEHLSVFYDTLSDIAHNASGHLYIGDQNLFIHYRDQHAPRGYDAHPPDSNEQGLYLIDRFKSKVFKQNDVTDQPLENILLTLRPQKSGRLLSSPSAFLSSPIPLYPLISRYLSSRNLMFKVSRWVFHDNHHCMIFEIRLRDQTDNDATIPQFLLSALSDLPDCHVFLQPVDTTTKTILVEYTFEYPCPLNHIVDVFSDNQMVLFYGQSSQSNRCISPEPVFIEGDTLIKGTMHYCKPIVSKSDDNASIHPLPVPVKLIHDSRNAKTASALILSVEESQWLIKTLYVLPEHLIQSMTVFWGESHVIVQAKELNLPIFPFGMPMQKMFDTHLFIPMYSRLVPSLPWQSIKNALKLSADYATFLTPDFRVDCALTSWIPLSRNVVSQLNHLNVSINVKEKTMPKFEWTLPLEPTQKKKQWLKRKNTSPKKEPQPQKMNVPNSLELAENSLSQNDPLKAGLYFFLADEKIKAAQCIEKVLTI